MLDPKFLENLTSGIPGYAGYAEREKRRETDQALRLSVAASLAELKRVVDRQIAEASMAMRFDSLEQLSVVTRRLTRSADLIRHAPAGYSALFAEEKVDARKLDALVAHDLALQQSVEVLGQSIQGPEAGLEKEDVDRRLTAVEEALHRRDELMKGVA